MSASQATQKRWLTASNGRLSKADLNIVLRKEDAWLRLPLETRRRLYELLPPALEGKPHNPDVHPLKTEFHKNITAEFKWWQDDLLEGKETKKWRDEAMQAGQDRSLGLWDDWKEASREERFPADVTEEEANNDEPEIGDSEADKDVVMG